MRFATRRLKYAFTAAVSAGVALGSTFVAPTVASASLPTHGPCYPGSSVTCHYQYGVVVFDGAKGYAGVDDGDTIDVKIDNVGIRSVRFTGINSMEMYKYSTSPSKWVGDCHAIAAGKIVYNHVMASNNGRKHVVRLASVTSNPTTGGRLRRAVATWDAKAKRWVDLGTLEMKAGLALWDANNAEYAWNKLYGSLGETAAKNRIGLYNPTACGSGPSQTASLRVYVKSDADGVDSQQPNGEWAEIYNAGSTTVSIAGWWLRDSFARGYKQHGFRFPAGTSIPSHGTVRLHAGCGTNTSTQFYWCVKTGGSVWDNVTGASHFVGDGAYLYDYNPTGHLDPDGHRPPGDIRAWMTYPCWVSCSDPLTGNVRVTASPSGAQAEYVDITNIGSSTVSLFGHQLFQNPDYYDFRPSDTLEPGQVLRLFMQPANGTQTPHGADQVRYWDLPTYQLSDGGDSVKLVNYRTKVIVCTAWGSVSC